MSQPPRYTPNHSFVSDSATLANFPGQQLDVEFQEIKSVTDAIETNLALIQRDDGGLANGIVTSDSLSASLLTAGLQPATPWATATAYVVGANVTQSSNLYRSLIAHTSGVFATDLAAGKWVLVAALTSGPTGATGPTGPANTLAIGTVTNGSAGATITGSAPNQTLNLVLPTGITGATGSAGAGYGGTSSTSLLIANSGTKVFATQSALAYQVGNYVRASSAANGANYMEGLVSAYSGTSLSIVMSASGGSGTFTDWVFAPAGAPGGGTGANPTASAGLSAVNGVAATFMRSDGAPALDVSIAPTWTATHTFSNGTYSALFSGGPVGVGNATPTATVHVGGVAAASSGANVLSARNSTGTSSVHGFAENSTINLSANGQGMDSYDARMVVSGTATYDHFVSYQSRPIYGSAGLATWGYGVWDQITANGPITNTASFYASNPVGTSTITNVYGLYVESLTKGGTLNYGVFTAGTTPSKFGGNVDVASLSIAGADATGVWSSYTPTVASAAGSITTKTPTGRYKQIGKTVMFTAQLVITTNGTGSGYVILGLPVAAKQTTAPGYAFSGIRTGLIGLTAIIDTTTTIDVVDVTGVYPGADGRTLYISGSYEAA